MGKDPSVFQMNGGECLLSRFASGDVQANWGRTPTTETLLRALRARPAWEQGPARPAFWGGGGDPGTRRLILILTDGEANNMESFMQLLDQCQNGVYGDVQICMLGISLEPADIAWFEEEECDETRIRTIEAYEVEQRQIRTREVVQQEAGYNFDLHSVRALVTNYYPADYDYEAPFQNLRHRVYITWHGRDRWWSDNCPCWPCISCPLNWTCFIGTGACLCGWLQGNDCGKCQWPELCPCACGEES